MTVQTNNSTFYSAEETSPGVVSASAEWIALEPEDITTLAATIAKISRNPISPDRMAKKGAISDLDSAMEYNADLTLSSFDNFAEGYLMSNWQAQTAFVPTSTTTSAFVHAAVSAAIPEGSLVYSSGMANSANNGLFLVDSGSTTTSTPVTDTLVVEASPPLAAAVGVAGVQGASGDIVMNSDGDLTTTTLDFTTLGLQVGQRIYIGGDDTDTYYTTAKNGSARVRIIAANKLTLDQKPATFVADIGAAKTIQLFIGSFIRNVPTNDSDFVKKTYQFEIGFTGLDTIDEGWQYSIGNSANQLTINLAGQDKATATFGFIGQDTETLVDTIKTGDHVFSYLTNALSTTADIAYLNLRDSSEEDLTSYFKNIELTINNNISAEKVIANLGGIATNIGDFEVTFSSSLVLDSAEILDAARNNETLSLEFLLHNDDGGLHFDIPSMTLDDSSFNLPRNESILIDTGGVGFKDDFFSFVVAVSKYQYLPSLTFNIS